MSSSARSTDSFVNSPLMNTIAGYIALIQERNILTKERIRSFKHCALVSIGFFVFLYCLVYTQILFFWLLKLILRSIFQLITTVFWLPLKTARFFIPKTVDYDILFPLFWLCSISSFYISKFSHKNVCQFYDQYLVRRYKIFNYDQTKREDIKRYLFILTFITLLLLQSLFILVPIVSSIRRHHQNAKTPIIERQTATIQSSTSKTISQEAAATMSENLYNRFVDAFKDENEKHKIKKHSRSSSDEEIEDTLKTVKNRMNDLKSTDKQEVNDIGKTSRFQRWIVNYLKAPFQKRDPENDEDVDAQIEEDNEEESIDLDSSSSMSDFNDSDDEDDEDDQEEYSTIAKRIQYPVDTVKNLGKKLKEDAKTKASSFIQDNDITDDDEEADDNDEDDDPQPLGKNSNKLIKTADKVQEKVSMRTSSSIVDDEYGLDYDSGNEGEEQEPEQEQEKQSSKLTKKSKKRSDKAIKKIKNSDKNIKHKLVPSKGKDEELSHSTENTKKHLIESIDKNRNPRDKIKATAKQQVSSKDSEEEDEGYESHEDGEEEHPSTFSDRLKNFIKPVATITTMFRDKLSSLTESNENEDEDESIKDKIFTTVDDLQETSATLIDSVDDAISNTFETSPELLTEKLGQVVSKIEDSVLEPLEDKVSHAKKTLNTQAEQLKEAVDDKIRSLKKMKKTRTLTETTVDKAKSLSKPIQ